MDFNKLKKDISDITKDIKNGINDQKILKQKYKYLFENTPSIFFLITENKEEKDQTQMLEFLVDSASYVTQNNNKKDNKVIKEKDDQVNNLLAERYLYPVLGTPEEYNNKKDSSSI